MTAQHDKRVPSPAYRERVRREVQDDLRRENGRIADAARSYCRAMHANKDAEPVDWERARAEVDRTFYEMMKLCGYFEERIT